jgi:WD40 repeat protein
MSAPFWEMLSGRALFRIGDPSGGAVQALSFSPDGKQLAAGDWGGEIGTWFMRSAIEGARLHHPDDVKALAFSPDARFIATAADDNIIRVWNTGDSSALAEIKRFAPKRLVFADDSLHLLVESQEGGLEVMSVGKVLQARQLVDRTSGETILTARFASYESGGLFDIWQAAGGDRVAQSLGRELPADAYALDDKAGLLAVAYQGQDAIEIWNIAEAPPDRHHSHPVQSITDRHQPSCRPAYGRPRRTGPRRRPLRPARLPPGDPRNLSWRAHSRGDTPRTARAELPTLLPDGRRLFFATGDWQFPNDVHVVDPAQEDSILTLEDVREVHTIRVAQDGEHLAITDGKDLRVWDLTTGRVVSQLPISAFIYSIGFSPDGQYLATASQDDDLTLWAWRTEDLTDRACRHLTRNLDRKEWQDLRDVPYRPTCPNLPTEPGAEQTPM